MDDKLKRIAELEYKNNQQGDRIFQLKSILEILVYWNKKESHIDDSWWEEAERLLKEKEIE